MLDKLKGLLKGSTGARQETGTFAPDDHRLAAAVLMIEAAHLDGSVGEQEANIIKARIKSFFDLSVSEAEQLFALAEDQQARAVHLHRFTKSVKDALSEQERIELIELLWEVVYADGEVHAYEAHLLRRVGGLIHVSDRDRGDARKRVEKRLREEQ